MSEESNEAGQSTDDSDFPEPMEGKINEGDDGAGEYAGEGFDPLQRRFLWTMTAVIILGLFGSAWLIVYYQQRAQERAIRISVLAEEHNDAKQQRAQAQSVLGDQILRAYLQGDMQAVKERLDQLTGVYRSERQALVNLRKEQGIPTGAVTEDILSDYANDIFNQLKGRADAIRQQAAASTQPSSNRTGSSSGSASSGGPAGAPPASAAHP